MIAFVVPGLPQPGGSKRAFVVRGRAVVTEANPKAAPWRAVVQLAARQAYPGPPLDGPLRLHVDFLLPRPQGHVSRKTGLLLPRAPRWPAVRPDATKLLRALEDALTGIVWRDDAQIVDQCVRKHYAPSPGASVVVTPLLATW